MPSQWPNVIAIAVAATFLAVGGALRVKNMGSQKNTKAELQDQIHHLLWRCCHTDKPDEQKNNLFRQALAIQMDHPELDAEFLDRYITAHVEEWELIQGLSVLAQIGWQRPFDHRPLVGVLKRTDVHVSWKRDALRDITRLTYHIQESELFELLDSLTDDLRLHTTCGIIRELDRVPDRSKALRLLMRCLREADTANPENRTFLLDELVGEIDGNADVYENALNRTQVPHEVVLLAVSLLRETLPNDSPFRKRAEEASKQSDLAADYLKLYVKMFITRKKRESY